MSNRPARGRLSALAMAAVLSMLLSGCGFLGVWPGATGSGGGAPVKKVKLTTPYSVTETVQQPGTFTPAGGTNVTVKDQIVKGTFSAKLPSPVNPNPPKRSAGTAGGAVAAVSGSFISKLGGTSDFATGAGSFSGIRVIDFTKGAFGVACLSWESKISGNTETGTFRLIGGTKLSGKSRFSGTYTGNKSQGGPGQPATVTGTLKLAGKVGKPAKAMNAECKALAAQQ